MLNLICNATVDPWWLNDWRFYAAIITLGIVALIAIVGFVIFTFKRKTGKNYFKAYAFTSFSACFLYFMGVIAYGVYQTYKAGEFKEKYQIYLAIAIFALIIVLVVFCALWDKKKSNNNNTTAIVYAAVCIAMSFALSYLRIFKLPQGGSITIASLLPIALYSYIFGWKRGILCCIIYGLLQVLQDPYVVHPLQLALDYPIAFAFVGLSGIFKKYIKNMGLALITGLMIGLVVRYISHMLSGAVYFSSFAPEGFSAWAWGSLYNLFVFADGAIAMIAGFVLLQSKQMQREVLRIEQKYKNNKKIESVT